MYIPKHFELEDREVILSFIRKYNFALIVSRSDGGRTIATHLPFHITEQDGALLLTAHMSRANPQWKEIMEQEVLVVFSGPHAYISPAHYEQEQSVPTWNYISVHLYGRASIITEEKRGYEILEELMRESEPGFLPQWQRLDPGYKQGLFKGIVPFEIRVTEVQAKHKLSQNKTGEERSSIIDSLSRSEDGAARDTAGYMRDNEQRL